ncbi:hypothetical protein [Streptomyces flaveolus]|uniref:hypothetical protein n=1 Tax=Streptomyces flaveolus TaxID=67297 RepID=UPI0036B52822
MAVPLSVYVPELAGTVKLAAVPLEVPSVTPSRAKVSDVFAVPVPMRVAAKDENGAYATDSLSAPASRLAYAALVCGEPNQSTLLLPFVHSV